MWLTVTQTDGRTDRQNRRSVIALGCNATRGKKTQSGGWPLSCWVVQYLAVWQSYRLSTSLKSRRARFLADAAWPPRPWPPRPGRPLCSTRDTRRSASAEGPRDAMTQLKPCQLLRNCTKNRSWKDLQLVKQAQNEYKHSLTFRVRRYVVIATKLVHRLQIRSIVRN